MDIKIRNMNARDLDDVVTIHKMAFEGFFLTRMGPRFLYGYYQSILDFNARIAVVAEDAEASGVLGFAVGFRDPQGFYEVFRQQRRKMIPAVILAVLRDPGLLPQIFRNLRRVDEQSQQQVDAVELSSIAVGAQGSGVGGALLEAFADTARAEGADKLYLTTDAEENDAVRRFYEARGFSADGYEYRGDRQMCRYLMPLV